MRALPEAIRLLVADPRAFAEGHVRANYDYVHSAAQDERCAGYQDQRSHVYRIQVPAMYKYEPPAGGTNITRPPFIWADANNRNLNGATRIAFDPHKPTLEVDLIFDIPLAWIESYKLRNTQDWVAINWLNVVEERL